MRYIEVRWTHNIPDGPFVIYAELDEERWEQRKIELFKDGRTGHADRTEEVGGSMLGLEPWPDLAMLGSEPEFEIAEISKDDFEMRWANRI
jgi:hypothetical protein